MRSTHAAAVDAVTGEISRVRFGPGVEGPLEWLRSLPGPVRARYEAGPTGFGLYRALGAAGIANRGVRGTTMAPRTLHCRSITGTRNRRFYLFTGLRLCRLTALSLQVWLLSHCNPEPPSFLPPWSYWWLFGCRSRRVYRVLHR